MLTVEATSEFGWDDMKKCAIGEESVWAEYLKSHNGVASSRNKPFPLYEDLCLVYAKGHAKCNNDEGFIDAAKEVSKENCNDNMGKDMVDGFEEINDDVVHTNTLQWEQW